MVICCSWPYISRTIRSDFFFITVMLNFSCDVNLVNLLGVVGFIFFIPCSCCCYLYTRQLTQFDEFDVFNWAACVRQLCENWFSQQVSLFCNMRNGRLLVSINSTIEKFLETDTTINWLWSLKGQTLESPDSNLVGFSCLIGSDNFKVKLWS